AFGHSCGGNRGNKILKTVTIDEAGGELFWRRNEVVEQDYFCRAKGAVPIVSPDCHRSIVSRTVLVISAPDEIDVAVVIEVGQCHGGRTETPAGSCVVNHRR